VTFSSALSSIEVVGDNAIKVTSSSGAEEVVNELVLTCPVPDVRCVHGSLLSNAPGLTHRYCSVFEHRSYRYSSRVRRWMFPLRN